MDAPYKVHRQSPFPGLSRRDRVFYKYFHISLYQTHFSELGGGKKSEPFGNNIAPVAKPLVSCSDECLERVCRSFCVVFYIEEYSRNSQIYQTDAFAHAEYWEE